MMITACVSGALTGLSMIVLAITIFMMVRRMLPGAARDHRDNDRVLQAYLRGWNETTWSFGSLPRRGGVRNEQVNEVQPLKIDAWDLSPDKISMVSRLGIGRLSAALLRLESLSMIEGYWQGSGAPLPKKRRYVLTNLGQAAARDPGYLNTHDS